MEERPLQFCFKQFEKESIGWKGEVLITCELIFVKHKYHHHHAQQLNISPKQLLSSSKLWSFWLIDRTKWLGGLFVVLAKSLPDGKLVGWFGQHVAARGNIGSSRQFVLRPVASTLPPSFTPSNFSLGALNPSTQPSNQPLVDSFQKSIKCKLFYSNFCNSYDIGVDVNSTQSV